MNTTSFQCRAYNIEETNPEYHFIGLPEQCPECKRGQQFKLPYHIRLGRNSTAAYGYYQCSFSDCRTPFIGNYRKNPNGHFQYNSNSVPNYTKPMEDIPELIDSISETYRKIYLQAYTAEADGLDMIAGCGYRKALEFLIKDFAIYLMLDGKNYEDLTEEKKSKIGRIKKAQLGTVINDYLNIPKVKSMASRATWIGNDETHYERRLEQGDISIMKDLMRLTILHIETEELTKKMEIEIKPSK